MKVPLDLAFRMLTYNGFGAATLVDLTMDGGLFAWKDWLEVGGICELKIVWNKKVYEVST